MISEKTILGTDGKIYVNGTKFANVKSFQAKITMDYEELAISEQMGSGYKYKGYSIEGTLKLHKLDDTILKMINSGISTGAMPDIQIVSQLKDPNGDSQQSVEIDGVVFTETMLADWEVGTVGEEEVPFKAESYKVISYL